MNDFNSQNNINNPMKLDVTYASDNNYAYLLGISLLSLLENNKNISNIDIHILDNGISDINKNKLTDIGNKYNRDIYYYSISNIKDKLGGLIVEGIAISAYSRLFLTELIPNEIEQLIYIDCDTLVLDSLEKLCDFDFGKKWAAGVLDVVPFNFKGAIGLGINDKYFNSGMLLLNLKEMRAMNIMHKIQKFLSDNVNGVPHHDQGVINNVFKDRVLTLPPNYNVMTPFTMLEEKQLKEVYNMSYDYYSREELSEAVKNPIICHLTEGFTTRPWVENSKHYFTEEFNKYKLKSPWADTPAINDSRRYSVKIVSFLFRILPFKLFSFLLKQL